MRKLNILSLTGKRFISSAVSGFIVLMSFGLNGCITDAFDVLTQEVPYSVDVKVTGTATSFETSKTIDLNENDFYQNNSSKINSIKLAKLAYKTRSVSPAALSGTLSLTVKQSNGVVLFSKIMPGNKPSDYQTTPFEISLTGAEISLVNAYLSILTNRQFTATVKVETGVQGSKTIDAQIFAVFEMEYDN